MEMYDVGIFCWKYLEVREKLRTFVIRTGPFGALRVLGHLNYLREININTIIHIGIDIKYLRITVSDGLNFVIRVN